LEMSSICWKCLPFIGKVPSISCEKWKRYFLKLSQKMHSFNLAEQNKLMLRCISLSPISTVDTCHLVNRGSTRAILQHLFWVRESPESPSYRDIYMNTQVDPAKLA
jgi:hypothetical protein